MNWKYCIEPGDLVTFQIEINGRLQTVHGSVNGWVKNEAFLDGQDADSYDEINTNELMIEITSGNETVQITLDNVSGRVKKEERKTDIPSLSERLRLSGGVEHARNTVSDHTESV